MADIFISYSKRHAQLTEDLARDLEAEGYTTWWDTSLLPGDEFPEEIKRQLDAAQAVIVIWTESAVKSKWVRAEATRADGQNKLITVRDAGLDPQEIPLPFNTRHSDLVSDRAKIFAALARKQVAPSRPVKEPVSVDAASAAGEAPHNPQMRSPEPPLSHVVPEHEYWADTKGRADPNAFERFLVRFPDGDFAALAASRAEERIASCNDPGVLERLLREFPNSPRAGRAKGRLALLLWRELERSRDKAALGDFARRFAGSPEAERARARLERLQGGTPSAMPKVLAGVAVAFLGAGVFWYAQRDGGEPPSPAVEPVVEQPKQPQEVPPRPRRITKLDPDRASVPLSVGELAVLKPKDEFQECKDCPRMVVIPSGEFLMGSPEGEEGQSGDEKPQHKVTIPKPFAVGRAHVTRDQFAAFVKATGHNTDGGCRTWTGSEFKKDPNASWRSPGFDQDGDHPAVCLNWNDAVAYVDWLTKKTGKTYRLLSEAEAEYAARGVTRATAQPRYFFGNSERDLCTYANGADETAKAKFPDWTVAPCKDGHVFTAPVMSFRPNAFGLYDVHGNAWTWTQDCWNKNYHNAPDNGSAWTSGNCSWRVLRGGSWNFVPQYLRAAYRISRNPDYRVFNLGFRVARTLNH